MLTEMSRTWEYSELITGSFSSAVDVGTGVGPTAIYGYMRPLIVMYAASDISRFTPISAPLKRAPAATTTVAKATGTNNDVPPRKSSEHQMSTSQPSSSLSTGARAAIGVTVGLVSVSIIVGLAWLLLRRRRRRRQEPVVTEYAKPELQDGFASRRSRRVNELSHDGELFEMAGRMDAVQIDGRQWHELEGR